jgi:hypothetical protein
MPWLMELSPKKIARHGELPLYGRAELAAATG